MTAQETAIRATAALVAASVFRAFAVLPDEANGTELLITCPRPVLEYVEAYLTDCSLPIGSDDKLTDDEAVLFWLLAAEDAEDEGLDLMDGLEVRVAA